MHLDISQLWLMGGCAGGIITIAKMIKDGSFSIIQRKATSLLYVRNTEPFYDWVMDWINNHDYVKKSKLVSVREDFTSKVAENSNTKDLFLPAPGMHFFKYKNHYVIYNRIIDSQHQAGSLYDQKPMETITIRILRSNQAVMHNLVEDIIKYNIEKKKISNRVEIFTPSEHGYWINNSSVSKRKLSTVMLPGNTLQDLIDQINNFQSSFDFYSDIGVPYRFGFLLYGPPGSGKTSTVIAIASYFNKNIYTLNVGSKNLTDDSLSHLMAKIPKNNIVLLEDADSIFIKREESTDKNKNSQVTFAGLLNCIDGVLSSEGRILFMTTNHRDRLDPALIRTGRIDKQVYIGFPEIEQIQSLVLKCYQNKEINPLDLQNYCQIAINNKLSMSDISGNLLAYHNRDFSESCEFIQHAISQKKDKSELETVKDVVVFQENLIQEMVSEQISKVMI